MKFPTSFDGLLAASLRRALRPLRRPDGSWRPVAMVLPNALCFIRLLGVPPAAWWLWRQFVTHNAWGALAVGLLIMILLATDAADGTIARTVGSKSALGPIIDPLADKVALASLLILWASQLSGFGLLAMALWVLLAIRVSLDATLAVIAFIEQKRGLRPRAGGWGKYKFCADILAVLLGLIGAFGGFGGGYALEMAATAFLIVAIGLGVMSLRYHWDSLRSAKRVR